MTLQSLDLFAGIGGFALGFERAGIQTSAFCEINPYARKVLETRFPGVPIYPDITKLSAQHLTADGVKVDIITGGFPCQDISIAGGGVGLAGARSGLWFEFHRLIEEVRPAWVVIENSPVLRSRGLDVVLRGLDEVGYDAEWHCIPASALGAPHRRDRVWIVAHSDGAGSGDPERVATDPSLGVGRDAGTGPACLRSGDGETHAGDPRAGCEPVAVSSSEGLPVPERQALLGARWRQEGSPASGGRGWSPEPDVGRVAHGVPKRVDRLRCLGNAVIPQIPEMIGRAILAADCTTPHS